MLQAALQQRPAAHARRGAEQTKSVRQSALILRQYNKNQSKSFRAHSMCLVAYRTDVWGRHDIDTDVQAGSR